MPRHDSGGTNVLFLLRQREVSGGGRRAVQAASSSQEGDGQKALGNFAEEDFLRRCSASYCDLNPPPRSTIATAFSPDGRFLASTHGDHTVKIICHRTGQCLKVLSGHRRTPWVVRFHPTQPHIVASGSLDYEVRVWDVELGKCLICFNFGRPIASLAFHAAGIFLAVASGHKLYMWEYSKEGAQPMVVLKTRRSLRAVHFQPHGTPLLLTAEVNDGNAPDALPIPISADLEEPALLPGAAQGPSAHGQLAPMDPAPPSNLTPSLAQGGQPYSAAQQILGITSRAGGTNARSMHMQPQLEQTMMSTPQAPVHARAQHGTHSLSGLPSLQEIAAGLAAAEADHAQVNGRVFPYSEEAAQLSGQYASHHVSQPAWGWLPGQARRHPAAQSGPMPGPGIGLGPEPMDWQRQGISTLDLRSRPPRQREFAQRSRDRTGSSFPRGGAARPHNPQQWQAAAGNMVFPQEEHAGASSSGPHESGAMETEAGLSGNLPRMQSITFGSITTPISQAPGSLPPWQMNGVCAHAGPPPGFPFYQQQPPGGFPRRWPTQLGSLPSGFANRPPAGPSMTHTPIPRVMFPPDQDPLNWSPMWRPVMPQSSAMPMLQPSPAPQGSAVAGRFGFSWPSPGGWTEFRPFQMFRSSNQRAAQQQGSARRHREGRRGRGEGPAVPRPAGERTQDLVEQFDSRWLGTGDYDPSMLPEGLEGYARTPDLYSRGMHAPLPPSMVPVGWEYPAHLLQPGTIRAGEPAQATYSAADSVAVSQPGRAQQDAAAVRASAAAANVISNEQPCRVKLRIWRYSPTEDVPGTSGALKGKSMEKGSSKHGHNDPAAVRQHFAALVEAAANAGNQVSQTGASSSTAPALQQRPEGAQKDSTSGQEGGALNMAVGLDEAAGVSPDAQPTSDGEPGESPVTPPAAAGGSEPEAMSDGEERGGSAPETDAMRTPVQQPGESSAASRAVEAAGPSMAAHVPQATHAPQQQQEDAPQESSVAPETPGLLSQALAQNAPATQTAPATEATPPEDAGVRRGAVNQPQRASRHAHPKPLEAAALTISDAVLCSEMGVHFSPCGRLLAACVACQGPMAKGPFPAQARQSVAYEVRIYSISGSSFGEVIWAKRIRAAHCLTSLQFSPTSEHILLAYGRRHVSLLRSLVADVESSVVPYHTIVEVYRVAPHMPLMRVLPSAADEVNAALFHPFKGGGIAYGTKEGRLRVLRHSATAARGLQNMDSQGSSRSLVDELIEADQLAAAQVASSDED